MKKFLVKEYKGSRTDPSTGEITEFLETKEVVKAEVEPFFLTYSKQIMALYDSTVLNNTTKVLYKLLEFAEFNTGKVYMNSERVEEIMQVCNMSRVSYHRAIKELLNIGIISKNRTTYTIAENMFWKGDRNARAMIIDAKLQVAFSPVFEDGDNISNEV